MPESKQDQMALHNTKAIGRVLKFSGFTGENLPLRAWGCHGGNLKICIRVKTDGKIAMTHETVAVGSSEVSTRWEDELYLYPGTGSDLILMDLCEEQGSRLASLKSSVDSLLKVPNLNGMAVWDLKQSSIGVLTSKRDLACIKFAIESRTGPPPIEFQARTHGGSKLPAISTTRSHGVDTTEANLGDIIWNSVRWDKVLKHVAIFPEIWLYNRVALRLLSTVTIAKREERTTRELVRIMLDCFAVLDTTIDTLNPETGLSLTQQTLECAYLLSSCNQDRSILATAQTQFYRYSDKFNKIKFALQNKMPLILEPSTIRIVPSIQQDRDCTSSPGYSATPAERWYQPGVGIVFSVKPTNIEDAVKRRRVELLPGSHPEECIIREIFAWASGIQREEWHDSRIFLLTGGMNSDKADIAIAIAHYFEAIGRLGSVCHFRGSNRRFGSGVTRIFTTISNELAKLDPQWGQVKKPSAGRTQSVGDEFERLILDPARHVKFVGPTVIIIDGLDQAGNEASRKEVLSVLQTNLSRIPLQLRIIILSTPEEDICSALRGNQLVYIKQVEAMSRSSRPYEIDNILSLPRGVNIHSERKRENENDEKEIKEMEQNSSIADSGKTESIVISAPRREPSQEKAGAFYPNKYTIPEDGVLREITYNEKTIQRFKASVRRDFDIKWDTLPGSLVSLIGQDNALTQCFALQILHDVLVHDDIAHGEYWGLAEVVSLFLRSQEVSVKRCCLLVLRVYDVRHITGDDLVRSSLKDALFAILKSCCFVTRIEGDGNLEGICLGYSSSKRNDIGADALELFLWLLKGAPEVLSWLDEPGIVDDGVQTLDEERHKLLDMRQLLPVVMALMKESTNPRVLDYSVRLCLGIMNHLLDQEHDSDAVQGIVESYLWIIRTAPTSVAEIAIQLWRARCKSRKDASRNEVMTQCFLQHYISSDQRNAIPMKFGSLQIYGNQAGNSLIPGDKAILFDTRDWRWPPSEDNPYVNKPVVVNFDPRSTNRVMASDGKWIEASISPHSLYCVSMRNRAVVYRLDWHLPHLAVKVYYKWRQNRGSTMPIDHPNMFFENTFQELRRIDHKNVVSYFGFTPTNSWIPAFIMEWVPNGDVLSYMKANPHVSALSMIVGVANGLSYLHGVKPIFLHGDLRGANVLIDEEGNPKLSDGMITTLRTPSIFDSTASPEDYYIGPWAWQAPELMHKIIRGVSAKTDVYSLGMTCLEIFTGERPFREYELDSEIIEAVRERRERPRRPSLKETEEAISDEMWELWVQCWDHDHRLRPTASSLSLRFATMQTHFRSITISLQAP